MQRVFLFGMLLILLTACANKNQHPSSLEVELFNTDGDSAGTAKLQEKADGVKIELDVSGLESGWHGFHIHEEGTCEGPDFKSAGAHYNPEDMEHGLLNPKGPHAGDLPNVEANEDGEVKVDVMAPNVTLKEGKNSLLKEGGTALVIHENADDGMTQPAGDGGKRVLCGEIQTEQEKKAEE
ncbi:superoxide dismutase family protein [Bacillus tianshenii]|nr:superoxide dismutase family protein [Bacillus tianshenii]